MRLPALLVIACMTCAGSVARAADRTDVLVLNNGDRITGEILNLNRGRVELKTDNAGTVEVEWDKVVSIESKREFTVTTTDGRRTVGRLGRGTARTLMLGTGTGEIAMAMDEITGIEPLGRSFWTKLEGSVGAGFNYTRSSGVAVRPARTSPTGSRRSSPAWTGGTLATKRRGQQPRQSGQRRVRMHAIPGPAVLHRGAAQVETNEAWG